MHIRMSDAHAYHCKTLQQLRYKQETYLKDGLQPSIVAGTGPLDQALRGCSVFIFMETWLSDSVPDRANQISDMLLIVRCRPFYLPLEFTTVYIVAVCIPPNSNTDGVLDKLSPKLTPRRTVYCCWRFPPCKPVVLNSIQFS